MMMMMNCNIHNLSSLSTCSIAKLSGRVDKALEHWFSSQVRDPDTTNDEMFFTLYSYCILGVYCVLENPVSINRHYVMGISRTGAYPGTLLRVCKVRICFLFSFRRAYRSTSFPIISILHISVFPFTSLLPSLRILFFPFPRSYFPLLFLFLSISISLPYFPLLFPSCPFSFFLPPLFVTLLKFP